jgi:hypothetical protein
MYAANMMNTATADCDKSPTNQQEAKESEAGQGVKTTEHSTGPQDHEGEGGGGDNYADIATHLEQGQLVEHDGGGHKHELACEQHHPPPILLTLEVAVQLLEPEERRITVPTGAQKEVKL